MSGTQATELNFSASAVTWNFRNNGTHAGEEKGNKMQKNERDFEW